MIEIATGDRVEHEVYGEVEVVGFTTVSDEIELNTLERDGKTVLDIASSVQDDKVEFIDNEGRMYSVPLRVFYENVDLN